MPQNDTPAHIIHSDTIYIKATPRQIKRIRQQQAMAHEAAHTTKTIAQIALEYGVSTPTVDDARKRYGAPKRPKGRPEAEAPSGKTAQLVKLMLAGSTPAQAARKAKTSRQLADQAKQRWIDTPRSQ